MGRTQKTTSARNSARCLCGELINHGDKECRTNKCICGEPISTINDIICDRNKKVTCSRFCSTCGACESVLHREEYEDPLQYKSDRFRTLQYRKKVCPMYGPCPEHREMSIYDTCKPTRKPSLSRKKKTTSTPRRKKNIHM